MSLLALAILVIAQSKPGQLPPDVGQDPPRLRTRLSNGSELLVEPAPKAKTVTVHLFAAARGVDEHKVSGLRHLLEHLCVRGRDGKLDARLESAGAFLRARTLRDAMDIQIDVPPGDLQTAFDALSEIMATSGWTRAEIGREAGLIEQESVLQSDDAILTAAIWAEAYGGNGADPMGEVATIRAATPEQLEAVRKATFASGNLLLVIEGPVGLNSATKLGMAYLNLLKPHTADLGLVRKPVAGPKRAEVDAFGEARGVPVPSLAEPECVARLCAALAIASELKDAYVTYTPSSLDGMVVVGQVGEIGRLGKFIDSLGSSDADAMLIRAKVLGLRWAKRQVATPEASAYTRGLLMSRDREFDFDAVEKSIVDLSETDFRSALASFNSAYSFVAVGGQ